MKLTFMELIFQAGSVFLVNTLRGLIYDVTPSSANIKLFYFLFRILIVDPAFYRQHYCSCHSSGGATLSWLGHHQIPATAAAIRLLSVHHVTVNKILTFFVIDPIDDALLDTALRCYCCHLPPLCGFVCLPARHTTRVMLYCAQECRHSDVAAFRRCSRTFQAAPAWMAFSRRLIDAILGRYYISKHGYWQFTNIIVVFDKLS